MQPPDLTEAIRSRAYEIWLSEGCPQGRDRIHWLHAEAEIRELLAAARSGDACKSGLHEKPVERRGRTPRPTRRKEVSVRGSPSSTR